MESNVGEFIMSDEDLLIFLNGNVQQFSFTVTDNCTLESSNGSIQVSLTQLSPISIDLPDYSACNNDLVTLEPNVSGGSGDFSYSWYDVRPVSFCGRSSKRCS